MPSISFGGINTGLPPNLVDQMIEAERIPIKKMEGQKGKSENKLKLVNELDTKINDIRKSIGELASTKGFQDIKLMSGDPNIVQGVVDPGMAQPGSWNVEVVQLAQKASVMTNGFPDRDKTEVGVGYFRFKTPDGEREVYINGENSTLDGVAGSINNAHLGVKASVINDRKDPDAPFKIVISADGVGNDNSVEYPTLYFLDGDQDIYFDKQTQASNGIVKIDGIEFEIADNTLKDLIPGVSLELKQAAPGRSVNLTVKEDLEIVSGKIKTFVDAMNGVFSFIQQQNALNEKTDTTQTLGGDSMLRSVEQRMRSLVMNPQYGVRGDIKRLNELGIMFNRNGLLELNQEKFNAVLGRNPDAVSSFLAGDGFAVGFIPTLKREIANLTNQAMGTISNRRRGLEQKIEQIDKQIEDKERHLVKKEESLRNKFAKLEETMSRLRGQGNAVAGLGGGGAQIPKLG